MKTKENHEPKANLRTHPLGVSCYKKRQKSEPKKTNLNQETNRSKDMGVGGGKAAGGGAPGNRKKRIQTNRVGLLEAKKMSQLAKVVARAWIREVVGEERPLHLRT